MDSILNVGIRLGDCAAKRLVYVCDFEENVSSNQEMLNRCLGSCPKNYCSSYKLGKEVAAKLTSIGYFEVVADKLPRAPVEEMPIEKTVGLETTLLEVWRCLGGDNMGTIGLYGMGCFGKTILKRINNEFCGMSNDFNVVIRVEASKDADVTKVFKSQKTAIEIYKILRSKKFVLLLDDVWKRFELLKVGVPLPHSHNGSKVCGHMEANRSIKVGCLEQDKAFDLFLEKVGQESLNSHPEIPHLAKVVAEECKGLPLALISIGHSMASRKKLEDWERAIELLRSYPSNFSGIVDYVYHLLEFSYDSLPNATLQSSQRDIILEKMNLLIFGSKREEFVNIHDVIRDMALWLACESGEKKNKFLVIFCPKLITLLIRSTLLGSFPFELFEAMCHRLTIRVGKLENLQYLDLPRTDLRALPVAMKNPKKLKCLLLNDTYNLTNIRSEVISSLSSLQVSSILQMPSQMQCCPQYDERALLEDLECLEHLEDICITIVDSLSVLRLHSSNRMEHLEILQIWKGDPLKIYLEMQRVLDSFLGHIHNNSKTITDHEKMHDHGILVVVHCDVGNELACSCIMHHAFKLSRVVYYSSIKEVLANDLEEDSGHENVHVFSCLTNLHLQGLPSLKSISLQALAFLFIKENKVFDCPSLRSYLLIPKLVNNMESQYQRILTKTS
ncbi:hypothetical protein UlMin_018090 [Ulmus minor]